jgi:hypothetical protein
MTSQPSSVVPAIATTDSDLVSVQELFEDSSECNCEGFGIEKGDSD